MALDDSSLVKLELTENNVINIKLMGHPLEIEDNLFNGVTSFTEEESEKVKDSIFLREKSMEVYGKDDKIIETLK
ncbi:MAG: hypothetical protein ACTSWY_13935 [Promethearchaeota archaeon]